jgi:hypothetical protein
MRVQVLKGSKQQIAQSVAEIPGEVREAMVFVEDSVDTGPAAAGEDIFAEMEPFTVQAGDVDYSRDSLYSRQEGE